MDPDRIVCGSMFYFECITRVESGSVVESLVNAMPVVAIDCRGIDGVPPRTNEGGTIMNKAVSTCLRTELHGRLGVLDCLHGIVGTLCHVGDRLGKGENRRQHQSKGYCFVHLGSSLGK